jgi:hypothetical protein
MFSLASCHIVAPLLDKNSGCSQPAQTTLPLTELQFNVKSLNLDMCVPESRVTCSDRPFFLFFVCQIVAWMAGVIAVTPIDVTYMGKWAGLEFANTQQKTLPYDLELNLIFQHGEGTKDTAAYQVS